MKYDEMDFIPYISLNFNFAPVDPIWEVSNRIKKLLLSFLKYTNNGI
jgi:hypothetical protein